jgi:sugar/nucleoside kinase (ribokinase family)
MGFVISELAEQLDSFACMRHWVVTQAISKTIHIAPFRKGIGSTGSGKSMNLHTLGVPLSFYCVLGDDSWGDQITRDLYRAWIDLFYDIAPASTERHINIMDAQGKRISMFITQSSEVTIQQGDEIKQRITLTDVIVLNIIANCNQFIPLIQAAHQPVWTDLYDYTPNNPYHELFIQVAQYIQLSSDNFPTFRQTMIDLYEQGKELIICTHGAGGADVLNRTNNWHYIDSPAINHVVDAIGAGDAFFRALIRVDAWRIYPQLPKLDTAAQFYLQSKKRYHPELNTDILQTWVRKLDV